MLIVGTIVVLPERGEEVADFPLPTSEDLTLVAKSRIFFAHQSVGDNIIGGVRELYGASDVNPIQIVQTRAPVTGSPAFLAHTHIGVNGDPLGKIRDFEAVLGGSLAGDIEVALIKLCYVDIVASSDVNAVFGAYSSTLQRLEAAHPKTIFLYTTVPLTTDRNWKSTVKSWLGRDDETGPADNMARERYNRLVRQRYAQSGRLFDIAAVESGRLTNDPSTRREGDDSFYVLNRALSVDPGHLNELGSRAAAATFIRVVSAALAGK